MPAGVALRLMLVTVLLQIVSLRGVALATGTGLLWTMLAVVLHCAVPIVKPTVRSIVFAPGETVAVVTGADVLLKFTPVPGELHAMVLAATVFIGSENGDGTLNTDAVAEEQELSLMEELILPEA